MKNTDFSQLIRLFAMPVIMILLGAILIVNPDSAAVLASTVISWILMLCGTFYGLMGLLGTAHRRFTRFLTAALCLLLGIHLLHHPLLIARNIGRVLGIIMGVEGIQNLMKHSVSKAMALLTLLGSVILLTAPMTASRLVFSVCGIILAMIGISQFLERLRRRRLNKHDDDPNIIDAL